jgi:DNA modification methylase
MSNADALLFGTDLFGDPMRFGSTQPLALRFEFPPFSVLSAREGEWQERKRAWIALGIQSELGREADLTFGIDFDEYRRPTTPTSGAGTSMFDPVLAELCSRWFCPVGGQIVDPFAGGSVRGIVAGLLGFKYCGIDLRAEQVVANEVQRAKIAPEAEVVWVCGDSLEKMPEAPEADFIFSCPPYGDLERYSDDPRDLSTMEYHTFLANYKRIILRCFQRLKNDRLACFVVGDFRNPKTGYYRGFVADTINAFREVGMHLYNDAVLVTSVGSLPIRVSGQFVGGRKLGKTHQNVLVFAKGDPRRAFA